MSDGEIPKVIRDGKVAVIVSGDYGAPYASECSLDAIFSPKMVMRIERGDFETPGRAFSYPRFRIEWVPVGTKFYIHEYDGMERVVTFEDVNWIEA